MSKTRKSFTLDDENARWLEQRDNASAVVNRIVKHARVTGEGETAGIDAQIEQKRREFRDFKQRIESIEQDIDDLKERKQRVTNQESAELTEAKEVLADVPKDPTNPGIQNWADRLGMTPQELIEELGGS